MAKSQCPKCEGSRFEVKLADKIKNCNYKMYFIQCASCGSVVGITEYQHIPTLLDQIAKKLGLKFK